MDVPGFMGMALSMSEINKKLNALSQQKDNTLSLSAPLRAATVKPVPKSRAPLWVAAGCCVALMAGGTGWWLGSQNQAINPAEAAHPVTKQPALPAAPQQIERPKSEPTAVESPVPVAQPDMVAEVPAEKAPSKPEAAVSQPETVKPVAKQPMPPKAEVKKAPRKSQKPEPAAETAPPPKAVSNQSVESHADEQSADLSIETVELDAGQLAKVEYQKAKKALKSGDSRKAIGYLESALKYQPEWVKARQKLSALYYGRGDTRKAVAALQQGLALDSEQPDLRLTMAKLLVNESQQQAALNVLSRLPESNHSDYLAMRGALAQQLKNNELAMSSYQLLVKEQPYDGRWWMGLGIALERSEAAEKARDAYQQALLMGRISQQSQQFIQQRLAVLEAREG